MNNFHSSFHTNGTLKKVEVVVKISVHNNSHSLPTIMTVYDESYINC